MGIGSVFVGMVAAIGIGSVVWSFGDMPLPSVMVIWAVLSTLYNLGVKSSRTARADHERGRLNSLSDAQLICRLSDRTQQKLRDEGIDVDTALRVGRDLA